MDLLADLTPAQREAVTHVDGPLLVLAGAGSGKTRVITRRVAYLLGHGIVGKNVLALTFTNKAAGEMRQRIEALAPESGVWVGTFHSLCARLLRTYAALVGLDRGFTIYDQADRLRAVKEVMERLDLDSVTITPERIDAAISRAKNDLVGPEALATSGTRPRRCRHRQGLSRLPGAAPRVVGRRLRRPARPPGHDPQGAPGRPRRARRPLPLRPGRRIPGHEPGAVRDRPAPCRSTIRNLCVTGDPDQSIYGWRGANLEQHPRVRARLPRLPRRQARAELPQHQEHPPRRRPPDPVQPAAQAQGADDREPRAARRSS